MDATLYHCLVGNGVFAYIPFRVSETSPANQTRTSRKAFPRNEAAGSLVGSLEFVFRPAPLETPSTSHR